jgi:hypothetical protein
VQRESSPALGSRHEHDPRRSHRALGRYSPADGLDSENADLFAHNTIVIAAYAERIWTKLIDAAAWPAWYANLSDVVVDDSSGRLGKPWPRSLEHQPQVPLRVS